MDDPPRLIEDDERDVERLEEKLLEGLLERDDEPDEKLRRGVEERTELPGRDDRDGPLEERTDDLPDVDLEGLETDERERDDARLRAGADEGLNRLLEPLEGGAVTVVPGERELVRDRVW